MPKDGKMSRHFQFEANMSLSGANADVRIPVTPSQQKDVLNALAGGSAGNLPENVKKAINTAKNELRAAGSKGIVVTGLQNVPSQTKALEINANSEVIDVAAPRLTRSGDTRQIDQLVKDMKAGQVGICLLYTSPSPRDRG